MEILILILVSLGASCLTFFSGFGLGTMLTPVFYMLSGDLVVALAMTAVVHFANNLFKFALMRREVNWSIALQFGGIAIPAAYVGAKIITELKDFIVFTYPIGNELFNIYLIKTIFGIVLILFSLIELIPSWSIFFGKRSVWIGGLLSGFFGGLSGHQGALRTAFLVKFKLPKEAFIATGIVIALVIDVVRTPIYFWNEDVTLNGGNWTNIFIGVFSASIGAIVGRKLLKKIKFRTLNITVAIAMLVFGILLIGGFLEREHFE